MSGQVVVAMTVGYHIEKNHIKKITYRNHIEKKKIGKEKWRGLSSIMCQTLDNRPRFGWIIFGFI